MVKLQQTVRVSLYTHNVTVEGVITKLNATTVQITFSGIGGGKLVRTFYNVNDFGIFNGYGHKLTASLEKDNEEIDGSL